MADYKAGDTIELQGERMNGFSHTFTLTIAEVYPDMYDTELDSFIPFVSIDGHWFDQDQLITRKHTRIGRFFFDCKITNTRV